VRTAPDEYLTCQACQLHALGVELGLLPEIACESQLVSDSRERPKIKLEPALVSSNKRARETAIDLLGGLAEQSGVGVLAVFRKKYSIMYGLDKKWCIEFALVESHVGEKGEQRLRSKILESLPTALSPRTAEESCELFEAMSRSALLAFCGAGMGHVFENIFEWVRSIRAGRRPQFQGESSDFISNAKARLANFLVTQPSTGDSKPLLGRDAVSQIFSEVKALVDASSVQMCMAKLSPLQVFGWLLTADEAKLVSQWTEAEYEKGASTEVAPSAKAKAGSRKRSGQDALAKLEALMKD
jgi:hypothetical protein